ncbi:unnamed protein product [Cuscuta epithymum]|uniref:Uncharacterized protein n=1 Tax=Cuscuta epithymum TaxID=186058 RepID=A0AAV0G9K4_9ASTE|nr:unnamed protein product [Cuscuta epithymum]
MPEVRTLVPLPIPVPLLLLAGRNDPHVIRYSEENGVILPMAQINPPEPTPGSQPRVSEGPESSTRPQRPVASWPHDDQTMSAEGHTRAEETTHDSPSVATTQDADDEGSGSKAENDNDDDDEDDDNANTKGKKVEKARAKKGRLVIRLSRATTQEQSHQIKDTRGNIISETRSKVRNDNPSSSSTPVQRVQTASNLAEELALYDSCSDLDTINRANPIGAETDIFSFRVEDAASSPTAHAQASPSHSAASQQVVVSHIGDLLPTLLPPYEAAEDLLCGLPPQTTTPPSSTLSLVSTIPTFSIFSRTHTLLTPLHTTGALYLSSPIGDTSMMIGSPATQQISPSLSAGHTSVIFTDVVTTVTTPVTGNPDPTDLSVILQRFLDSTIKPWVHEAITARAQEFRNTPALLNDIIQPQPTSSHTQETQPLPIIPTQQTSEPSTTLPHSPTASRGTQDTELVSSSTSTTPFPDPKTLPFEVLENLMLDQLLATEEGNLTQKQKDLLRILKPDSSCRDSVLGHKRSHEDPDDSDPHEGENKRQRILERDASTNQPSTQSNQPESSNNQPPPSTQHKSQTANSPTSSPVELETTLLGSSFIDVDQGWSGSPEVATSSTPFYSGHQKEPSSNLMITGNPSDPGVSHDRSPSTQQQAHSKPSGNQIQDELEDLLVHDQWPREWTEWDDLRVEAEQYEMCRSWQLREFLNKYHAQMIGLDEDELKEGENHKENPKAPEPVKEKWEIVRIKAPFLEEIREKIWRQPEKIKKFSELKMRGINHLKGKYRGGNLYMLGHRSTGERRQVLNHNLATSGCPISKILDITEDYLETIKFLIFRLRRTDGSEFTCQENDFFLLHMDDIYQMFMRCRELPVHKDRLAREGFEAIKRFMTRQVRFYASHDLQMTLEHNYSKANLTRPDLDRPGLETFTAYYTFDKPISVIYLNHKEEKRLMIVEDIQKYCDGTLQIIREQLQPRKEDLDKRQNEASKEEIKELERVNKILKAIEKQLDRRRSLRNYEHALNLRKHYFKAQK